MLKQFIHRLERRRAARDTNKVARPFEWGETFLNGNSKDAVHATPDSGSATREEMLRAFSVYNDNAIADSHRYFEPPGDQPQYVLADDWLSFQSPIASPYDTNNTAYARYFRAGETAGPRQIDTSERRAVLVIPQWNADPEG